MQQNVPVNNVARNVANVQHFYQNVPSALMSDPGDAQQRLRNLIYQVGDHDLGKVWSNKLTRV